MKNLLLFHIDIYFTISAYSVFWTLLALTLSFIAYVLIPMFLRNNQPAAGHNEPLQRRSSSLSRYFWWCLGLLTILLPTLVLSESRAYQHRPITLGSYAFSVLFIGWLTFHITDSEARTIIRRHLFNVFRIEEDLNAEERLEHGGGQELPISETAGHEMTATVQKNNESHSQSTIIHVKSCDDGVQ
jgi:hypothetical protein